MKRKRIAKWVNHQTVFKRRGRNEFLFLVEISVRTRGKENNRAYSPCPLNRNFTGKKKKVGVSFFDTRLVSLYKSWLKTRRCARNSSKFVVYV